MDEKNRTLAIVVTGAIGAGKTPMAETVATRFCIPLLTEGNGRNFYSIKSEVDSRRFPVAIFEHCSLLNIWEQIAKEYDHVVWVVLRVDEELLRRHYEERLSANIEGGYRDMDPIEEQLTLLRKWSEVKNSLDTNRSTCIELTIEGDSEYDRVTGELIQKLETII